MATKKTQTAESTEPRGRPIQNLDESRADYTARLDAYVKERNAEIRKAAD